MVDLGTVQINELSEIDKKFSQHHSYCNGASFKNRFLPQHWPAALHLALATHQSSIISFSSCTCWPFLFEKLSSLSTSVAFRIGCIRSYVYELAFSSIVNTFSVLSIALMIGRHHLSKFRNCYDPLGFCKYECGL